VPCMTRVPRVDTNGAQPTELLMQDAITVPVVWYLLLTSAHVAVFSDSIVKHGKRLKS
jgi:hypothetical protein